MVLKFWIWSLRSDFASCLEYPSLEAKASGKRNQQFDSHPFEANKPTRLELEFTAENVHQELNNSVHRRQRVREQKECDHDGIFIMESKRLI